MAIIPGDHELQQALIDYMVENKRQKELTNYVSLLSRDGNLAAAVEGFETPKRSGSTVDEAFNIRVKMFGMVAAENLWGRIEENRPGRPIPGPC